MEWWMWARVWSTRVASRRPPGRPCWATACMAWCSMNTRMPTRTPRCPWTCTCRNRSRTTGNYLIHCFGSFPGIPTAQMNAAGCHWPEDEVPDRVLHLHAWLVINGSFRGRPKVLQSDDDSISTIYWKIGFVCKYWGYVFIIVS